MVDPARRQAATVPATLAKVHELQERRKQLATALRALDVKVAQIKRDVGRVDAENAAAEAYLTDIFKSSLIAGVPFPEIDPALVEKLRQGNLVGNASAAALAALASERASLIEQIEALDLEIAGAIFTLTQELQGKAHAKFVAQLPKIGEILGQLVAIEQIREKYCSGRALKLTSVGSDKPWSGAAVALKFMSAIPSKLSAPEVRQEHIEKLAAKEMQDIISQIEG